MDRALVPEDLPRAADADRVVRAREFIKCAQMVALHGNRAAYSEAAERLTPRVLKALKGAVAPMDTTGAAAVVPDLQPLAEAFASTLVGTSVFDTLLARGMRVVPLRSRGVVISTTATGSWVGEGEAKPISEMSLTGATLEPQKAWAAVAATKELLDFSRPGAREMFRVRLQEAVTLATDAAFLGQLYTGVTASVRRRELCQHHDRSRRVAGGGGHWPDVAGGVGHHHGEGQDAGADVDRGRRDVRVPQSHRDWRHHRRRHRGDGVRRPADEHQPVDCRRGPGRQHGRV